MLQWMGGSRRKVTTSRKSTLKRQKQYFEQRRRLQQNLQMTGSKSCSDVLGIIGQYPKEYRSLDILSLLDLSANVQECDSACPKGREDVKVNVSTVSGNILINQPTNFNSTTAALESRRIEEAKAPLGFQIEASPKKVLGSSPKFQNGPLNGIPCKPTDWKAVSDQHLGLSVIDLLYDDGPNVTVEERPTFEDHVAFSLEGLGKVGTETPMRSPEQLTRMPCGYFPLLKGGKKTEFSKDVNHVLEDLELEVDSMMQDIEAAPISGLSDFPFNRQKKSLATAPVYDHFIGHFDKYGSSISQEFFYDTENNNDDIWDVPSCGFLDEKFGNESGYNTPQKEKTFDMGTNSPDFLKSGICERASYAFEDQLPKKRSSAAAMEGLDMIELPASYSKYQYENDYDFLLASGARCSRSVGNYNVQSLVLEDVRDSSSLQSEESCTSTAVRGKAITHSASRLVKTEISKEHKFASASPGNKCRSKEECISMSNSSRKKPSHYSNPILEEKLGASANINSSDTSCCQNLENLAFLESKNRTEDPFSVFTTHELQDKASPSFSGFKSGAHVTNSFPCSITSGKIAFGDSPVFSDVRPWPTCPKFSSKPQFKGPRNVASFHCKTSSPGFSVQESVSKDEEMKVKQQKDSHGSFELREEIFMGNNGWTSEKKAVEGASTSDSHTQDCKGEKDPNVMMTQSLETTHSIGHVEEEVSSSLKKTDKHESKVDNTNGNNCDDGIPIKCNIGNEVMENWQPEEGNMVTRKHNKERIDLSGQVMFESYVLQFLCIQKVLKEASLGNFKRA